MNPDSAQELLRGFSAGEIERAKSTVIKRPEPPLLPAVPRHVTVSVRAFNDTNANGVFDQDDHGLEGVLVSDGENVARTGEDGMYEFSFNVPDEPHCRFVFATQPSGYLPFHQPFLLVKPDDTQTVYQADFPFVANAKSLEKTFSFITTSDSQFNTLEEMITIAKDYDQMTSGPGGPAFLVTAGDLTQTGTHYEWDMYDIIRGASAIDVYNGFGGHDGNCLSPRCSLNYELRIGPPYYSWEYGGVHFIQLISELPYLKSNAQERHQKWIAADLGAIPQGMPVIVVSHYPLSASWFDQWLAKDVNIICQIGAHWHCVMEGSRQGVPVLISAPARGRDWGAYSRTYRWVHVTPEEISTELRVAGQYKRLKVFSPPPKAVVGAQPFVVVAYDSARPVRNVSCQLSSPSGKTTTPALASQGDWTWSGQVEMDETGEWTIQLQATDATGEKWERTQQVHVDNRVRQNLKTDGDLPWVLAGDSPRRLPEGPGPELTPLWVKHTGSTHVLHSSPVTHDGRVFVATTNPNSGSPGSGVLCMDAATGDEIWKADSPLGDIRGTVTVHEGRVYAITGQGWVVAYDEMTGRELWSKPLQEDYRKGVPLAINQAPPVPTSMGILASDWQTPQLVIDHKTGKTLSTIDGNVGYYSAFATVFDEIMYCARRGGAAAIDLQTGKTIWSVDENSRSTSAGIVINGKFLYSTTRGLKAVTADTGGTLWEAAVPMEGNQKAIPVAWDQLALVNGSKHLSAVDLSTGDVVWNVECGRDPDRFVRSRRQALSGSSTPVIAGEYAYFGHDDTSLRAVNKQGDVVWEQRLGTPIKTAPAVAGNLLFVHDFAGNLWCFIGVQ